MEHDKKIRKGNSSQSGDEVHHKTMGHIEDISKAMKLEKKLPTHQALTRESVSGHALTRKKKGGAVEDQDEKEALERGELRRLPKV